MAEAPDAGGGSTTGTGAGLGEPPPPSSAGDEEAERRQTPEEAAASAGPPPPDDAAVTRREAEAAADQRSRVRQRLSERAQSRQPQPQAARPPEDGGPPAPGGDDAAHARARAPSTSDPVPSPVAEGIAAAAGAPPAAERAPASDDAPSATPPATPPRSPTADAADRKLPTETTTQQPQAAASFLPAPTLPAVSTPGPAIPPPPPPTPSTSLRLPEKPGRLPPLPSAPSGSAASTAGGPSSQGSSTMEESFAMIMGQAAPLVSWEASASSVGSFGLAKQPLQPPASPTQIVQAVHNVISAVTPVPVSAQAATAAAGAAAAPSVSSNGPPSTTTTTDASRTTSADVDLRDIAVKADGVAAAPAGEPPRVSFSRSSREGYEPGALAASSAYRPRATSSDGMIEEHAAPPHSHPRRVSSPTGGTLAPPPGTPAARRVAWIFTGLVGLMVAANLDNGALPASLKQLEEDPSFRLNLALKGFLGSCTFIGLTFGAALSGQLLQVYKSRRLLTVTTGANVVFCLWFALSDARWMLFFTRACVGATKATAAVFCPVWVDNFGPHGRRTLWMSLIQGASPIGIMFGYLFAGIFNALGVEDLGFCFVHCDRGNFRGWRLPFIVQSALMSLLVTMLMQFPSELLDTIQPQALMEEVPPEHRRRGPTEGEGADGGGSEEDLRRLSAERSTDDRNPDIPQATLSRVASRMRHNEFVPFEVPMTIVGQLKLLLSDAQYVSLVATLSSLYFVVTGIQFWITDFLTAPEPDGMNIPLGKVVAAFAATSATSPILGVVTGGFLIDRIGGYRGHKQRVKAIRACCCFGACAVVSAFGTIGATNLAGVIGGVWLLLFFGAMIVPVLTGVLLTVVPAPLQSIASSTSIISFQVFGYILAPLLCGVIAEVTTLRWGFRLVLLWSILGFVCLLPCAEPFKAVNELSMWLSTVSLRSLISGSPSRDRRSTARRYDGSLQFSNEAFDLSVPRDPEAPPR